MSGGVDSSVAAALLQKQGYSVVGIFMKCWENAPKITDVNTNSHKENECPQERDEEDARRVAAKLGIPFYSFDFTKEYKKRVVDYMIKGYQNGVTPNPDVMCNKTVKFGIFLDKARALGADFIATGHYVKAQSAKRKAQNYNSKFKIIYKLLRARDQNKDQSYFLWTLTQEQLKYSLFPIGDYTKGEVRKMAKKWGLSTHDKKDSQGICFIGQVDVRDFLKTKIKGKSGPILNLEGKKIGEHIGLPFYTIGQRKGIEIGGTGPYYVARKDSENNALVVAPSRDDKSLYARELIFSEVNWISGKEPNLPVKISAVIRYHHKAVPGIISDKFQVSSYKLHLNEVQRAVTPGQSVVFYQGNEIIGGGVIK